MNKRPFPSGGAFPFPLPSLVDTLVATFPEVWLVGGAMRDALLGRATSDFDLAVAGNPVEVVRALARREGYGFVLLDEERAIARIVIDEPRLTLDVAPLEGGSILADLARRDFTINAIGGRVGDGEVVDPFHGVDHLREQRLTLVSEGAFADDPARLLRLYRFAVSHDLAPDDAVRGLVVEQGGKIQEVAKERLWQELTRLFASPCADVVAMMAEDRLLDQLFPDLAEGRGMTQNRWHHLDVFDHSLETLRRLESLIADPSPLGIDEATLAERLNEPVAYEVSRGVALRLAALLHDIGKPTCRAEIDGVVRFIGHDETGGRLVADRLSLLGAPNKLIDGVVRLVRHHLRPLNGLHDGMLTPRATYRYRRDLGDWVIEGAMLAWADALATSGPAVSDERREVERMALVDLLQKEADTPPPTRLLNGDQVMSLTGLRPGKEVGVLLEALEEAVGVGEVSTRDEAISFVRAQVVKRDR